MFLISASLSSGVFEILASKRGMIFPVYKDLIEYKLWLRTKYSGIFVARDE